MTPSVRAICLLLAAGLILAAGSIPADTTDTDAFPGLATTSDSAMTAFSRAIAGQDTVALALVFPEKVMIAMPGGKNMVDRASVIKYSPLLFDKFGGGHVSVSHQQMEAVKNKPDLVREAGFVAITRTVKEQVDTAWSGAYTIYWRLTDSTWSMERVFVGRK